MKIKEYSQATELQDSDVLLVEQADGTKNANIEILMEKIMEVLDIDNINNTLNKMDEDIGRGQEKFSDITSDINEISTRLNALADSDDETLDQLSEIVAYIKSNKSLIDNITTSKVSVSDIVDNLTSTATNKPLSAKQGKVLNSLISALTSVVGNKVDKVNGKDLSTNDFTNEEKEKIANLLKRFAVGGQTLFNKPSDFPNDGSSFGVSNGFELYEGFVIPKYSRIIFINYGGNDAALIAIDVDAKLYVAFRNNSNWNDGKVLDAAAVIPISKGGTGQTTATNAIDALTEGARSETENYVLNDDDSFLWKHTSNVNVNYQKQTYKTKLVKLWNYIKSKAESIFVKKSGDTMTGAIIFNKGSDVIGNCLTMTSDSYTTSFSPAEAHLNTVYNTLEITNFVVPNDTTKVCTVGTSSIKWDAIYAKNGVIQTSDRNEKNSESDLLASIIIPFILGLLPKKYKMNSGTSDRYHWGLISQDIEKLLQKIGLSDLDFAGFIRSPKIRIITKDENGNPLEKPIEEVVEGEYVYSLRYDEFIAPIILFIQELYRKYEKHEERITTLETENTALRDRVVKAEAKIEELDAKLKEILAKLD